MRVDCRCVRSRDNAVHQIQRMRAANQFDFYSLISAFNAIRIHCAKHYERTREHLALILRSARNRRLVTTQLQHSRPRRNPIMAHDVVDVSTLIIVKRTMPDKWIYSMVKMPQFALVVMSCSAPTVVGICVQNTMPKSIKINVTSI